MSNNMDRLKLPHEILKEDPLKLFKKNSTSQNRTIIELFIAEEDRPVRFSEKKSEELIEAVYNEYYYKAKPIWVGPSHLDRVTFVFESLLDIETVDISLLARVVRDVLDLDVETEKVDNYSGEVYKWRIEITK